LVLQLFSVYLLLKKIDYVTLTTVIQRYELSTTNRFYKMSDHDEDYSDRDEDHEEQDHDYDDEEEEEEVPYKAKKLVHYNGDGLDEKDYKHSDVATDKLVRSECCHKYFNKSAFEHQLKYGLTIPGLNTCIHCFMSFNTHKFADSIDLTKQEAECLKFYINTFMNDHNPGKCMRAQHGGKCILCDATRGVLPPLLARELEAVRGTVQADVIDNCSINDVIAIERPKQYGSGFVLSL
ncbi:hypothetical protein YASMINEVIRUS_971, partial [Yasminevirus sp. GU-2018]